MVLVACWASLAWVLCTMSVNIGSEASRRLCRCGLAARQCTPSSTPREANRLPPPLRSRVIGAHVRSLVLAFYKISSCRIVDPSFGEPYRVTMRYVCTYISVDGPGFVFWHVPDESTRKSFGPPHRHLDSTSSPACLEFSLHAPHCCGPDRFLLVSCGEQYGRRTTPGPRVSRGGDSGAFMTSSVILRQTAACFACSSILIVTNLLPHLQTQLRSLWSLVSFLPCRSLPPRGLLPPVDTRSDPSQSGAPHSHPLNARKREQIHCPMTPIL